MNIGIIDIGWMELDQSSLKDKALGGSETWLMQITEELSKNNNVEVFCETKKEFTLNNTKYIPLYDIINYLYNQENKYDFVILNRVIARNGLNFISLIKRYHITDCIFLQLHDLSLLIEDNLVKINDNDTLIKNLVTDPIIKGIVTLNEFHGYNLYYQYNILKDKIRFIPNGVDLSLFKKQTPKNRDNRILWSSCSERGLDILINDIYPIVKQHIPDFGIDIAGYNLPNDISNIIQNRDIKILGGLSKRELYDEMSKHKVWFYPGTFAETFCITMLEHILNGVTPVTPFTYGMGAVMGEELVKKYWSNDSTFLKKDNKYQDAVKYATESIIKILQNNNYKLPTDLINKAKEYTWDKSAQLYIDLYNNVNFDEVYTHKCVFLAQSCNHPFFKQGLKVVEQTWAKDIIDNKYNNVEFFSYTSCDETHPTPCIDGHTIYVDCEDDLTHTYSKYKKAYMLLKQHNIYPKYIFRTNTSTYINVKNIIDIIDNQCDDHTIFNNMAGYYIKDTTGSEVFQFNVITGDAYIIPTKILDRIMTSMYDETFHAIKDGDDIILSKILNRLQIPHNTKDLDDSCKIGYIKYKPFLKEDEELFKDHFHISSVKYLTDPNDALKCNVIRTRSLYVDINDRINKGKEFEHMKELHNAFIKEKENL